jgi:hypothetical protein
MRVFVRQAAYSSLLSAVANTFTPSAPSTGPVRTAHFNICPLDTLGQRGLQVAHNVAQRCEADYQQLARWFNIQPSDKNPAHFNVIIAPLSQFNDGSGGAFHQSCGSPDLYCDVRFVPTPNYDFTNAMVVAEAAEVFEAVQNLGWDCGASNGEGLETRTKQGLN